MNKTKAINRSGILRIVVALFMAIAVFTVFTMPQTAAAASSPPAPQSVKITEAKIVTVKVNGKKKKQLVYAAKWKKPKSKKGYFLYGYEYEFNGGKSAGYDYGSTDRTYTGTNKKITTNKEVKIRVRALYSYNHGSKIYRSAWATASKKAK